jgi:hypothetical protein
VRDQARVHREWHVMLAGDRRFTAEFRVVRPNGAVLWVIASGERADGRHGERVASRKRAAEKFREHGVGCTNHSGMGCNVIYTTFERRRSAFSTDQWRAAMAPRTLTNTLYGVTRASATGRVVRTRNVGRRARHVAAGRALGRAGFWSRLWR